MNYCKDIYIQNLKEITQNYWNIDRGLQKQVLSLFPVLLCLTFQEESVASIGNRFVPQDWQQKEPNQVKRAQKGERSSTHQKKLEPVRICGVTHNGFSEYLLSSSVFSQSITQFMKYPYSHLEVPWISISICLTY